MGKQVLGAGRQPELLSGAAICAQPFGEKLRACHQHITRPAADAQVDLARVANWHVQHTTRTTWALADQVASDASEQTERRLRAHLVTLSPLGDRL